MGGAEARPALRITPRHGRRLTEAQETEGDKEHNLALPSDRHDDEQVRPVSGKPITTLAIKAVEQRLASARADFIMARSQTRSTEEAEDTFAVRPGRHHERPHLEGAPKCHVATAASRPSRPSGGALRAALTRPTRRGVLPLCDEGQAFVAGYGYPQKRT